MPPDIATHRYVHKLGQPKKDVDEEDLWNRETYEEQEERIYWEQSFWRKLIYRTNVNNWSSLWVMKSALGADGLLCFGGPVSQTCLDAFIGYVYKYRRV